MKTVDTYIRSFHPDIQELLHQVRSVITETVPDAEESITYGIAGYKLNNKPLVYFGGFQKHIGFYATPTGHAAFAEELSKFKQGRGSVQFPIDKPLPLDLIKRIVLFRKEECLAKQVKVQSEARRKSK